MSTSGPVELQIMQGDWARLRAHLSLVTGMSMAQPFSAEWRTAREALASSCATSC